MILRPPEPITFSHDVEAFDCGAEPLNNFLRHFALQNQAAGLAKTYVVCGGDTRQVIAYYSLCAGAVQRDQAPARIVKGTPNHPIPVILLARLAVNTSLQGNGLGRHMMRDALMRCATVADQIGIRAVLVHAKSPRAAEFYAKYRFVPSPSDPFHLMLILKDLKALISE
jgi:GNAT superfamily N-acetyltransferase